MLYVLSDKQFLCHARNLVSAVAVEDDDVVEVGAVAYELVFLQSCAYEAFLTVDVQLVVSLCHFSSHDCLEVSQFGQSLASLAVFRLDVFKPFHRNVGKVCEVILYRLYLVAHALHCGFCLVLVELQYALHLYLHEPQDVVFRYFANHLRIEWCESLVYVFACCIHCRSVFKWSSLVYALLDEDAFQRCKVQTLKQFVATYFQFPADELLCLHGRVAQHVADGGKLRLVVLYHAAVWRQAYLAVGEGIERIDCLVWRNARSKMYLYLHLRSRQVFHLASLYLSFFYCLCDRVDEAFRRFRERQFPDDKCLAVEFFYLSPHFQLSATLAVVISRHVDAAARWEVGIQHERLAAQAACSCIAQFAEVVRQNLCRQAYGNAFGTLCQQQRKLYRQRYRLTVSAVVRHLPLCGLRVEHHFQRKLRQSGFYVSRRGSLRTGKNVSPVTLSVDKQVLLSYLHQSVADGSIAVRMKLHRASHDVGYLVQSSVVHEVHGVQDASLHRLQSVLDVRHRTVENHRRCIVQKPVSVHAAQMMHRSSIKATYISGYLCATVCHVCVVDETVVHILILTHILYSVYITTLRFCRQSYGKSSAEQNKRVYFLCRDVVTYLKLRKIERRTRFCP